MRKWKLKVWDGYTNRSYILEAESYGLACMHTNVYPPAYIWSIIEINP